MTYDDLGNLAAVCSHAKKDFRTARNDRHYLVVKMKTGKNNAIFKSKGLQAENDSKKKDDFKDNTIRKITWDDGRETLIFIRPETQFTEDEKL